MRLSLNGRMSATASVWGGRLSIMDDMGGGSGEVGGGQVRQPIGERGSQRSRARDQEVGTPSGAGRRAGGGERRRRAAGRNRDLLHGVRWRLLVACTGYFSPGEAVYENLCVVCVCVFGILFPPLPRRSRHGIKMLPLIRVSLSIKLSHTHTHSHTAYPSVVYCMICITCVLQL